jgi:hypothetical protein
LIRRWSDAGLLPAQRVGRRRERRLARDDLQRFLGQAVGNQASASPAPSPTAVTAGGATVSLDVMAKRFPTVLLCQYDAREFDGEIILRALKAHPDMFEQHLGGFLN